MLLFSFTWPPLIFVRMCAEIKKNVLALCWTCCLIADVQSKLYAAAFGPFVERNWGSHINNTRTVSERHEKSPVCLFELGNCRANDFPKCHFCNQRLLRTLLVVLRAERDRGSKHFGQNSTLERRYAFCSISNYFRLNWWLLNAPIRTLTNNIHCDSQALAVTGFSRKECSPGSPRTIWLHNRANYPRCCLSMRTRAHQI